MDLLENPYRGAGLPDQAGLDDGTVIADPTAARALFSRCPVASTTPLLAPPALADALGVSSIHLKDERDRLGLGSFKALGAAHVIAREASGRLGDVDAASEESVSSALADRVYVCASAGNHGLSVAAGARVFGARSIVYLAESVPEGFARRLRSRGAEVERRGASYEESMEAAAADAAANGWTLLSDASWPGYVEIPRRVMEGYLILGAEIRQQISAPPTHVFVQAGVGGLAAAVGAFTRATWGPAPIVCIVEPSSAPALMESVRAGRPVIAPGPVSTMGRLDCKEPSLLALVELSRSADWFLTVTDEEAAETVELLSAGHGIETTPSGAAGLAGLHHLGGSALDRLGVEPACRALAFVTEGVVAA